MREPLPVGARLDTSRVGAKTFTVRTSDNAGNAPQTVSYSVVYDFDGFLWPLVNPPRVNRWKAGLPVPVRFSLGSSRALLPAAPATRAPPCGGAAATAREGARRVDEAARVPRPSAALGPYMFLWKTEKIGRAAAASSS